VNDGLVSLYDTLARFQSWRGDALEMRKRLLPPTNTDAGPADHARAFDEWLFARLDGRPARRVLDLGCGLGASTQRWATLGGGTALGVTNSAVQVANATRAARRAGLGERCRFVQQDFAAPLAGPFDVVLAIESLGHANDLAAVLANVRSALAPRGVFVWVEDLLHAPLPGDADVAELAHRWHSPPLRDVATVRREIANAGLSLVREIDLTPQVPIASAASLRERAAHLHRWRRFVPLPFVRRAIDAFLGGIALERLYARSAACYRVWMSERPPEVA